MSTFDKQIKDTQQQHPSSSTQIYQPPSSTIPGGSLKPGRNLTTNKVALKNKEFNPPLNLYKGAQEEAEDKAPPSSYAYKPSLIKKSKRISSDQVLLQGQSSQNNNNGDSLSVNPTGNQYQGSQAAIDGQNNQNTNNNNSNNNGNTNLVIASREYLCKNYPSINEEPGEQSPKLVASTLKGAQKAIMKKQKRGSGSVPRNHSDEIEEQEAEDERKFLKPNLKSFIKKAQPVAQAQEPIPSGQTGAYGSVFEGKKQTYFTKEELEPFESPENVLRGLVTELRIDDWQRQFEGLNNLRRITQHHVELLQNPVTLHNVMSEVMKLVENLRSSVSKNAVISISEAGEKMKRGLDAECEGLAMRLLRKGCDSNSFITEEVKSALLSIGLNCSEYKISAIIIGKYQNKSLNYRINIAFLLHTLIERAAGRVLGLKDFDKLAIVLATYAADNSLEVRTAAKKTFSLLLQIVPARNELDKILMKVLPEQQYTKLKQLIEREGKNYPENLFISGRQQQQQQNTSDRGTLVLEKEGSEDQQKDDYQQKSSTLSRTMNLKGTTMSAAGQTKGKDPVEFENIPTYFGLCENSDWKSRMEGVKKLAELARNYSAQLYRHKTCNKYFDIFSALLNDSNAKVSANALATFQEIAQILQSGIEMNLPTVFNAICLAASSNNASNKTIGEQLYAQVIDNIENSELFGQLCNGASYAPLRARQLILKSLTDKAEAMLEKKGAGLFSKGINAVIGKVLEENKPELRQPCKVLIFKINSLLGAAIFDGVSASRKKQIQDILASGS